MKIWTNPEYIVVRDKDSFQTLLKELKESGSKKLPISIDVETTGCFYESGLDYYNGWLLGISLCVDKSRGYYIPLRHTKDGQLIKRQLDYKFVCSKLNEVLSQPNMFIGHNIKFDYKFLWKSGIELFPSFWDTSIAVQLINGDAYKDRALKKVIKNYVDIPQGLIKTFEDVTNGSAEEVDPNDLASYAINDVIFTYYLYESLKDIVDSSAYKDLFYQAECQLTPVLAQMELRGIRVDYVYFNSLRKPIEKYMVRLEEWFKKNYAIEVGSNQQVGKLFNQRFDNVKLKISDKGNTVTDIEALSEIANGFNRTTEIHKVARRVLSFRNMQKLLTTYIDKFPVICEHDYKDDGVDYIVHTDYDQVKNSGRLSSKPNIQNIPRNEIHDVRRGFVARDGFYIVDADYSSEELRLAAIASREPRMIEAYLENPLKADLHTLTAQAVFKKKKVSDSERHVGKTLNFTALYGGTKFAVSRLLKCSKEEAEEHLNSFYNYYRGIRNWKYSEEEKIQKNRYSSTLYGRRRYLSDSVFPEMEDAWVYRGAVRALINHIIQGTGADILKFSMVKLCKNIALNNLDAYILATTHDSITVEASDPEQISNVMKTAMEISIDGILLPVDIKVKKSFSKKA